MSETEGDDWGLDRSTGARRRARRLAQPVEDRFGVVFGWRQRRATRKRLEEPGAEMELAAAGLTPSGPDGDDAPIFVLGATWRSGSTLLQRLLLSSGDVMMWGEPWNRCDLVPTLRESLRPLDGDWPRDHMLVDNVDTTAGPLHGQMIPDLYPMPHDLTAAHRALFERLYAQPARDRGYRRWGFKETRLGAADARYLHGLFPDARILLLYRDPYASWSSYLALRAQGYRRWPDDPIVSPGDFGRMWAEQVRGFLDYPDHLPHLVVRYEDLGTDDDLLARLGEFCGVEPDRSVLADRVGRSHEVRLADAGAARIRRAVDPLAAELGYHPPT